MLLVKIPTDILAEEILKRKACKVDVLSTALRLLKLSNPMVDFTLKNLSKIKSSIEHDVVIYRKGNLVQPLYRNLRRKYEKCLFFVVDSDETGCKAFRDFELYREEIKEPVRCSKSEKCQYSGRDLAILRKHEAICTDQQVTIEKQVQYGDDKTVIRRLVELELLPSEALNYRKTFITAYDIESLEDLTGVSEMKNVEAVHRLASIAVSTNYGHSRCFVRDDSSHESAVRMVDEFLTFLDEINLDHASKIPDYFHSCIERIQELLSDESSLLPRDKMELTGLLGPLKKYILHDVYGFNSGKFSKS